MTSLEFTSQVQKISSSLRPVAMNLTRDADDAKDLVQETLLKALLNKDKFKAGTNLKAWLYTIMRNTFINNYNKITKRSSNIDSTEYFQYFNTDENYITHNGATTDFVVRDINEAIASLGSDYRTPFMMYYIGYKYLEIAEKLQIPIGTVKNRIHIARKDLKAALKVYAPAGADRAGSVLADDADQD
jgi:RNA polymerase sigma-70 factor (ECF subfamily)